MDKSIVRGVGINDSDLPTSYRKIPEERLPSGRLKRISCPYYQAWGNMLARSYSISFKGKHPTYKECIVCEEWLLFSNFKSWMETQDWEGNQLDKDYLVRGNKIYSPNTCIFLHPIVNKFLGDTAGNRGDYLLGCSYKEANKKYIADCSNPFSYGASKYVGSYLNELEAHLAWKKRKHEYSCSLATSDLVWDYRIKELLLTRYKNYNIVETHLK